MRISTRLRTTVPGLGTALQQCQCRAVSTTHGHDQARTQRRAELATKINQTLKDDKHAAQVELRPDTKTVSTPVGDLPISPVMDPAWMEAKERFKTPKAKQTKGKDGGRFRKKLFLNPYAHALATPWRLCPITNAGMPRYFLQDFDVVANPTTGDPWWVPGDLTEPASDKGASETMARTEGEESSETTSPVDRNVQTPPAQKNHGVAAPAPPRGYAVSRMDVLRLVGAGRQESTLGGQHITMLVRRNNLKRSGIISRLVWRRDMHLVVLENMRRQIVKQLEYFARLCSVEGRSYLTPCASWDDINRDLNHRGCVLWRSQPGGPHGVATAAGESGAEEGAETSRENGSPSQLATLDIPDAKYERKLPVHNLDRLLGEHHMATLVKTPLFKDNPLLVLGRRRTIPLQLSLWKLQGYLAEYD